MTQGEILKEKVTVFVEEEAPVVVMEKPGAKLNKLRNELQCQIAQRRSLLWQQRQQEAAEECDENEGNNCYQS